jgi:polyphenol oxidase
MQKIPFIQPNWPAPSNVRTASTLRSGGVSREPFDSFNLAAHVGDLPQAVAENRRLLKAALRLPAEPAWLEQIHSDIVVDASDCASPQRADACVARSSGRVCAVLTADCLPVLFCSRDGDRVAAAHAGWRGLAAGILDTTVGSLGLPGSELMAWLGPAISQPAFEVGDDVRIAMLARDVGFANAFVPNARGRWQCDLYELARRNLAQLGVHAVYGGGYCTYGDDDHFFSYRRDGQCGRMASLVWIDSNEALGSRL